MRQISGMALALGLAGLCTPAFAGTLASPNNQAPGSGNPSFYSGTGNPQDQFTINSDGAVELGLAAHLAYVGPVMPPPVGNVYTVPIGVGSNGRATWDYDFSIDMSPGGDGLLTFAAVTAASLTVTNTTTSHSGSYNPLSYIGDDDFYGSLANAPTSTAKHHPQTTADWGAQNSESLSFGFPAIAFNPYANDSYTITLAVTYDDTDQQSHTLSDTIFVNAVPEPASIALIGFGLAGLGVVRRRRRRAA